MRTKNTRNSARRNVAQKMAYSESFLTVASNGEVSGVKNVREDIAGFETWKFEDFEDHVRLVKLYPSPGEPRTLPLNPQQMENIQMKRHRPTAQKLRSAQHEAGHAVLLYALRLSPVRSIDLRIRIITRGNLHRQIANLEPLSLRIVTGATSIESSVQDVIGAVPRSIEILAYACQALGGIAGCQGDEGGADDDLTRFRLLLTMIPELASSSKEDLDLTVSRLRAELQILANEIIAAPVLAPRHAELAAALFENEYLDRTKIENILVPTTLPDYSRRIEEIGKRFNIPLAPRSQREGSLAKGHWGTFSSISIPKGPLLF
jgi:hypothetical protein